MVIRAIAFQVHCLSTHPASIESSRCLRNKGREQETNPGIASSRCRPSTDVREGVRERTAEQDQGAPGRAEGPGLGQRDLPAWRAARILYRWDMASVTGDRFKELFGVNLVPGEHL